MSMIGTFDGFTAARLGIYAAQQGLRVTGNNITNINTLGYTRQRVDQSSFKVGINDMYRSRYDNHVGSGALVTGINQIRDPFLDIRYRNTTNETYHLDTWLSGLQSIASILDEVGKGENGGDGLIYAQLLDLAEKLRAYGANPTDSHDGLVRESANALAALFRNAASSLDRVYNETKEGFYDNITEVNDILINIRDLNKSIREAEIHGDTALEMRDERNRQIDELAKYVDIKVQYSLEDVGAGIQVEKLTIFLGNANPDTTVDTDSSILVDGLYATQLSVPEQKPLLNTYDDEYLKGYLYLQELTKEGADQFLADNPDLGLTLGQLQTRVDDQGNTFYLVGTNFVDKAAKVDNKNFTIQLGKLLNSKNDEWKKITTAVTDVTGTADAPAYAKYSCGVAGNFTAAGQKFMIAGIEYTIDDEISLANANNPVEFAKFVAAKLQASSKYANYNISASGGNIIFTAKTPGAVSPGDDPPSLSVDDPADTGWISATGIELVQNGSLPKDANTVTTDKFGNTTTISYADVNGVWYRISTVTEFTRDIALDDNDLRGILQAQRELLTEEGEFASAYDLKIDEEAAIKRGIPYYQKCLDLLAQKFAESFNELNQGYKIDQNGNYLDAAGKILDDLIIDGKLLNRNEPLTEAQEKSLIEHGYVKTVDGKQVADLDKWLKENGAVPMGGPLFSNGSNGNDTEGINAHNIDIAYGWAHGEWGLVPKFEALFADEDNPDGIEQSTQNINADHMLALLDKALFYDPRDLHGSDALGTKLFEGSFNDFLSKTMSVQASDARVTNTKLNNSAITLTELDYSREGVSGVDLNDEAMNMVQFQKAMNAAMRVMTTIDEMLDRLINNTGIAGR